MWTFIYMKRCFHRLAWSLLVAFVFVALKKCWVHATGGVWASFHLLVHFWGKGPLSEISPWLFQYSPGNKGAWSLLQWRLLSLTWPQLMITTTRTTQKNLGRKRACFTPSLRKVDLVFNLWMSVHELQIQAICCKTAAFIWLSCPQPLNKATLKRWCYTPQPAEFLLQWRWNPKSLWSEPIFGKHTTVRATMPPQQWDILHEISYTAIAIGCQLTASNWWSACKWHLT